MITSIAAFFALFLTFACANQSSENVPNEIGLIFPESGTVVAGSYFDIGFIVPPYNGVSLVIGLSLTLPNKTTVPLLGEGSPVNASTIPSSCGYNGPVSGSDQSSVWTIYRPLAVGNYTISWNQTLYFFSSVDTSKDPATCSGPVTSSESSIISRTFAVVPASPGASATNSLGVITTTHTTNFNQDPTNTVMASFEAAPTGKVYVNSATNGWDGAGLGRGLAILFMSLGVMLLI